MYVYRVGESAQKRSSLPAPTQLGSVALNTAGVMALQRELRKLAVDLQKPKIDPAKYDGTMTLGTIIATANAASALGSRLNSTLGSSLDVVGLLKDVLDPIPYSETVIDIVFSPWVIDAAKDAILTIVGLFPGGGSAASTIRAGLEVAKSTVAGVSGALATAIAAAPRSAAAASSAPPGGSLGTTVTAVTPACPTGQYYSATARACRPIPACPTGQTFVRTTENCGVVVTAAPACAQGFSFNPATGRYDIPVQRAWNPTTQRCADVPACSSTQYFSRTAWACRTRPTCSSSTTFSLSAEACVAMTDHRTWQTGRKILAADWGSGMQFQGKATLSALHPDDRSAWTAQKNNGLGGGLIVARGALPFKRFISARDGKKMGAYFDSVRGKLTIKPTPTTSTQYPWDYAADAVMDAADFVEDIASDVYTFVADNAADVLEYVREHVCALVNDDLVVAIAAGGASLVGSPAAGITVVTAAESARAGCAVIEVGEALLAIYRLLSMDFPSPPAPATPTQPTATSYVAVRPIATATPVTTAAASGAGGSTVGARLVSSALLQQPLISGRLVVPVPPPPPPAPPTPTALFQVYDDGKKIWLVAWPASALLGAAATQVVDVREQPTQEPGAEIVTPRVFADRTGYDVTRPFLETPTGIATVAAGGLVVVGGIAWALLRRRSRPLSGHRRQVVLSTSPRSRRRY